MTQIKKMQRFVEYYGKPFTSLDASNETGLNVLQVRKVICELLKMNYIKIISKSKGWNFYLKNKSYVDDNPKNEYGFEIKLHKKLILIAKSKQFTTQRRISEITGVKMWKLSQHLTALACAGIIGIEEDKYVFLEKKDLHFVGKKMDREIFIKMGKPDRRRIKTKKGQNNEQN